MITELPNISKHDLSGSVTTEYKTAKELGLQKKKKQPKTLSFLLSSQCNRWSVLTSDTWLEAVK